MSRIRSEVREQVRQRAEYRCEYCRKPENFGAHNYQVHHIIAQKHRGTDELDNLAWACFRCNLNKGSDIASYDITDGALVPFYNPRTQQWQDHFHRNCARGHPLKSGWGMVDKSVLPHVAFVSFAHWC